MSARTRAAGGRIFLRATLLLLTLAAPSAQGAAMPVMYRYATSGTIGGPDGTSLGPITFQGSSGVVVGMVPGSINLGQFLVPAFPQTGTLTYNDTPFRITLSAWDGEAGTSGLLEVNGVLNGSITGIGSSDMIADVRSIRELAPLPFALDRLRIDVPQRLAPGGINGGSTAVTAYVAGVPEPTTLAFFGVVATGLGLRRLARRRPAA